MKKYIKYVELNEGYNPAQTFKSYILSNFEGDDIIQQFPKITKPYIERILQQPKSAQHENQSGMTELTVMDLVGAIYIYINDYDQNDPYIQFLTTILNSGTSHLNEMPNIPENLSTIGEEIYRILQLIGEDIFYELIVTEFDTIDNVNQESIQTENKTEVNIIDGMSKRKAQNFIYRNCVPATEGRWKDEAWNGVHKFFRKLEEFNIDMDLTDAKYYNFPYDEQVHTGLPYKEWRFEIPFTNNNGRPTKFFGTIRGSAAGSVQDPFDVYDVTVVVS